MKRSSFLLYLHSIASRDFSPDTVPSCANLPVIVKNMSWIQKFRYARCSETHRQVQRLTLPYPPTSDVPIETDALSLLSVSSLVSYPSGKQKRRKSRRTITSALIPCGRILLEVWNTQSLSVYIPLHLYHRTIAAFVSECPKRTKSIFWKKNVRNDVRNGFVPAPNKKENPSCAAVLKYIFFLWSCLWQSPDGSRDRSNTSRTQIRRTIRCPELRGFPKTSENGAGAARVLGAHRKGEQDQRDHEKVC